MRVFHTFLYMGKDAYTDFITAIGLRLPVLIGGAASIAFGSQNGPFELTGDVGGLYHTSGLGYEIWEEGEKGAKVLQYGRKSAGWVDMSWDGGGVAVIMRNMREESPKELIADAKDGVITAYLWPESANPINMRRYSQTPHRAQGESLAHLMDRSNYKILPYGIAKTHELLVYFHEGDRQKAQVDAVAGDFDEPALVYVSPEWYVSTRVYGDMSAPNEGRFAGADRVEKNLERIWDFFLFHQKFWSWYGMWDYGDIQHRFGSGYGWSEKYGQYVPEHGWAYDNGRWAWTNNESVPNYGLGLMYLRTGKREYYFAAEAMARHIMDVDVHHAGPWKGLGARHNVQHWGDGNREERHANAIS